MRLWGSSPLTKALMVLSPGQSGDFISDTAVHTGEWAKIQAITAAVIATVTSDTIKGTLTTITLPAGGVLFGHFTSIQLTSGTVMAYAYP